MKILITGVSGYVARVTLPLLLRDSDVEKITGVDIKPIDITHDKLEFIEGDVRYFPFEDHLGDIDTVMHLAFIVTEIKDKKKIYDINVNGTKRVLDSLSGRGVRKLVCASSICAYGSHPDHPDIITEDTPLRGNRESYYSHTKLEMERMLDRFEEENPGTIVTRLRPSILCGAGTDNFFLMVLEQKIIFHISGNPAGLPVVYDKDVGNAFYLATKRDAPGAFIITADNLPVSEMSRILKKRAIALPYFILKPLCNLAYTAGIAPLSSHWTVLGRYPFMASNEKAKKELGWTPTKTPLESFEEMVDAWKKK